MPSNNLIFKQAKYKNEIITNLCNAFLEKHPPLNPMQISDKIQANISYHILQPDFSTLSLGIMLHSRQLPVLQELKAVSTVLQINNQSTPFFISACAQPYDSIQENTYSANIVCYILFINIMSIQKIAKNIG